MRLLLAFTIPPLLVLAAIFFTYLPLHEETAGECSALERRVMDNASHDSSGFLIVGQLYGSSSSEPSGAAFAQDHYPMLPAALGCTLAYWQTAFNPPASAPPAARQPAPTTAPPPTGQPEAQPDREISPLAATVARGITPNGDPISPSTTFTLPMNSVAIRVDYRGSPTGVLRFQLMQGKAVIATCPAERAATGPTWCKFDVKLRKGLYSISFTADRVLLGQFPFTVIGR